MGNYLVRVEYLVVSALVSSEQRHLISVLLKFSHLACKGIDRI